MDGSEDCGDDHRRLATPCREGNVAVRSRSRSNIRQCSRHRSLREDKPVLRQRENSLRRGRDPELRLRSELHDRRRDVDRQRRRVSYECGDDRPHRSVSRVQQQGERGRRVRDSSAEHRSRSCSPSFSFNDICKIIQSIKSNERSQNLVAYVQSSHKFDYKNILPEFDPSTKNQRMDVWLRKVNECASVYGWDEKTTIHFSMQKLEGLAKTWYQSLGTILFTWSEWQEKLLKAFPYEENYGQSLEDMLRCKSRLNEPIENYFYEKLSFLNRCDISGKRAVDCIIHGLTDKTIKSSALSLRCSEPDQLLQFFY